MTDDQIVIITADMAKFNEELGKLIKAIIPVLWELCFARHRYRSRIVTRNKQRRAW